MKCKQPCLLPLFVAILLAAAGMAVGDDTPAVVSAVTGILCPTPVTDQTYVAVELSTVAGTAVTGLRWFNNDGAVVFPRLLVTTGTDAGPALSDVKTVTLSAAGASDAWSEITFPEPALGGGRLFAVFQLPANLPRTARGHGGGPGLGYVEDSEGPPAFLSADGAEWVPLSRNVYLAVEAVCAPATPGMGVTAAKAGAVHAQPEPSGPIRYETELHPVGPNPANPTLLIRFSLARGGPTVLEVFNVRGQRIRTVCNRELPVGEHVLDWNGTDDAGAPVASGTYVIRMRAAGRELQQKATLVR